MIETRVLTEATFPDFIRLMSTDDSANRCMCLWWIISVKDFHSNGSSGNSKLFHDLLKLSPSGMGLIAYDSNEPVAWCACGTRARYARAIKTPTFKGRDEREDTSVWLVPCFFVRKDYQGRDITDLLLREAIEYAKSNQATAIEGFPFCQGKTHRSGDLQVGFESTFERCGFSRSRSNSDNRVVMRLGL